MRSFLLTCALSASLAFQAHAQAPIQQQAPQMVPVNLRSHDFGAVARSAKTEHRFPITNIYKQDMHVSSVRASCGCTTPIIENKVIKPGQTGFILARFNTGTHSGQKQATLTVSISKPVFTELQLNVRGYIRTDVVFNPGEVNFGGVPEGNGKTLQTALAYAGRSDWKILDITSAEPFLKPTFKEVSRKNGQIGYEISVELTGSAPAGMLATQLILLTNDNRLTKVPLSVIGEIQSQLEVSPQQVALGDVKAGESVEQRFVLRGLRPFRVIEVIADGIEVHFEPMEEAKTVHLVNLRLAPDPAKGKNAADLVFKTDLEGDIAVTSKLTYKVITQSQGNPAEASKPLAVLP